MGLRSRSWGTLYKGGACRREAFCSLGFSRADPREEVSLACFRNTTPSPKRLGFRVKGFGPKPQTFSLKPQTRLTHLV